MRNKVICINRECGSGGDEIAFLLGQKLGIPVYEKADYFMIFRTNGIVPFQTVRPSIKYTGFQSASQRYHMPVNMLQSQNQEIKRLALESDCIFLGRCADWVLRDEDVSLLRVFISAPTDACIRRIMAQGETAKIRARKTVRQTNLLRMNYYESQTGQRWCSQKNYDLFIDSSETGIDGAVARISAQYKIL